MQATNNTVDEQHRRTLAYTSRPRRAARAAQVARLWALADRTDDQFAAMVAPLFVDSDDEGGLADGVMPDQAA